MRRYTLLQLWVYTFGLIYIAFFLEQLTFCGFPSQKVIELLKLITFLLGTSVGASAVEYKRPNRGIHMQVQVHLPSAFRTNSDPIER